MIINSSQNNKMEFRGKWKNNLKSGILSKENYR